MQLEFTAHNIQLPDGRRTRPGETQLLADDPWMTSAKRVLELVYPNGGKGKRIVDLGCLEGGYTAEFAKMGFDARGVEVRQNNFQCCCFVKENLGLSNLNFVQDTVWNIGNYGNFDAVFCCGLLYHLDRPGAFIKLLSQTRAKVVIFNTHYAPELMPPDNKFNLSPMQMNEGLPGRWFADHNAGDIQTLESMRWASWENKTSFWLTRKALLQSLQDVGFEMVFEQFDWLKEGIMKSMTDGYYQTDQRGMFVGVR